MADLDSDKDQLADDPNESANPNKITLNLQEGIEEEPAVNTSDYQIEVPELQNYPEYFKHASALTLSELEWTVTLSRYDFPWNEICFEPFTAKDCYRMYRQLVRDPQSFLKKVLGEKLKYQRMMLNQINGLPTYDTMVNMNMATKHKSMNFDRRALDLSNGSLTKSHAQSAVFRGFETTRPAPGAIFGVQHMNHAAPQQLG